VTLLDYQEKHKALLKDHLENGEPRTKHTPKKTLRVNPWLWNLAQVN